MEMSVAQEYGFEIMKYENYIEISQQQKGFNQNEILKLFEILVFRGKGSFVFS
jgi:hypothetical protein